MGEERSLTPASRVLTAEPGEGEPHKPQGSRREKNPKDNGMTQQNQMQKNNVKTSETEKKHIEEPLARRTTARAAPNHWVGSVATGPAAVGVGGGAARTTPVNWTTGKTRRRPEPRPDEDHGLVR